MNESSQPRWVRRALRLTGGTIGRLLIASFFVVALVLGAVGHLDLKVSRRVAAQLVMGVVSDSLQGTIQVQSFTRLESTGIAVDEIVVLDPAGRTTLKVRRLNVDVDVFSILERVLSESEKLSIEIERVRAEDCEVYLLPTEARDVDGTPLSYPSIADAFTPIETSSSKKKTKGRPIRLWFPHVRLTDVYAHGSVADSPVLDVRIRSARGKVLATDKGASIDVNRFRMKVSGIGGVDSHAHGEVHIRAPGAVWGDVGGLFGQVPLAQSFRYEDGQIDIRGEFPELKPEALRPLLGSWPLDRTIKVRNVIEGKAPTLTASAVVTSSNDASPPTEVLGVLHLEPSLSLDVQVKTKKLNLEEYLSNLPNSSLDSEVQVRIRPKKEGVEAVFEGKIAEGRVQEEATPKAEITGRFDADGLVADAKFIEPGLRADAHLEYSDREGVLISTHFDELDLGKNERARRFAAGTTGTVTGDVLGTLHEGKFDAKADLSLGGLRTGDLSVSHTHLKGQASGLVEAPFETRGSLEIELQGMHAGPVEIKSGTLTARGQLLKPDLEMHAKTARGFELAANARSDFQRSRLDDLSASITGQGKPVEARADSLSFGDSRLIVRNFVVQSIGEIRGNLDFGPGSGKLDVEAEHLSISRIAANLGLPKNEFGGDLSANIHLVVGEHSEGTLDLEVTQGALLGIDNVNVDAHATIEDRATRGNINGSVSNLGEIESSWEGQLAGPIHDPLSYERATGQMHASVRKLDLRGLSLLIGKSLGLPDVTGALTATLDVKRSSASEFPSAELTFQTTDFQASLEGKDGPIRIRGVQADGGLSVRPEENVVESVIRLNDRYGTLASLAASLDLPTREWGAAIPEKGVFREAIETARLSAALVVPRRRLDRVPDFVDLPLEDGNLTIRASASGSLRAPQLTVLLNGSRLGGPLSPFSRPVDIDINANYHPVSGDLRASFSLTSDEQQVGSGQADLLVPLSHFTNPPTGTIPLWTGEGRVQLDNASLSLIKELDERDVFGTTQGVISISREGWEPEVSSEVRLRGLEFGGTRIGDALLETQTYQSDLVARAHFTDEYGSLQLTAEAGVVPTPWFLEFATRRPIHLTLLSERFDAAIAHPFAADVLDELSGSLSGKLRAEWTPPAGEDEDWSATLSGNMTMTEGVITPTALGLRLEDAVMNLSAGPEGTMNVIRIRDISARAASEQRNLKGDATLYFQNLSLQGGTFHLSPTDVPLRSNDTELARLTGTAQGRFDMTDEKTRIELRINNLEATLPEASDSNLFTLEENPTIEVLQQPNTEDESEVGEQETVTEMKFFLGNNVRIKSEFIDIKLRGEPEMRLAEDLQMRGALELIPGGRILVLGRRFIVEEGTVLFDTADAADPHLSVSAAWIAPNGVLVRVTVSGTASAPQLAWTSEPALPGGEAEVIALVLGGGGGSSSDQGQAGITSGLAFAANEALGQTGTDRVQFYATQETSGTEGRIASLNDSNWESYTATYRISDELWFEGSYETASGTGPQTEARSSGISGTLDWRFHPHWSLRSEVGMLGAGLDLVWRYRY